MKHSALTNIKPPVVPDPITHSNRPTISAVIVSCNEAELIEGCLESVASWVDEIVIVDMESTDGVVEIATRYGARLFTHRRLPYVEPARNFALSQARCDWIILLDPDERVCAPLAVELMRLAKAGTCDAVAIPRIQRAFGAVLRSPGAQDTSHIRFFRRGSIEWPAEIHGVPIVEALRLHRIGRREGFRAEWAILHDTWRSPHEVLAKLARYAPNDALRRHRQGRHFSTWRIITAGSTEFVRRFLIGRSYRDGMAGFLHSSYFAIERLSIEAEMWELEGRPASADRTLRRWGAVVGAPFAWVKPARDTLRLLRR
jgi:glycosyltransferase involved in cell wall biosynthesis